MLTACADCVCVCVCRDAEDSILDDASASDTDSLSSKMGKASVGGVYITVYYMDATNGVPNHRVQLVRSKFLPPIKWTHLLTNREEGEKEYGYLPCLKLVLDGTTYDALSKHILSSWGEKQMYIYYASKKKSRTTLAGFPGVCWHKAGNGNIPNGVDNVVISVGKLKAGGLAYDLTSSPYYEAPSLKR